MKAKVQSEDKDDDQGGGRKVWKISVRTNFPRIMIFPMVFPYLLFINGLSKWVVFRTLCGFWGWQQLFTLALCTWPPSSVRIPHGRVQKPKAVVLWDAQYLIKLVINKRRRWFSWCLWWISHLISCRWKLPTLLGLFIPKDSSKPSCSKQLLSSFKRSSLKFKSHYFRKISALQNLEVESINQNSLSYEPSSVLSINSFPGSW